MPPLLGRSALARQRDADVEEAALEFSLTWGDRNLRVTSPAAAAAAASASRQLVPPSGVCVEETVAGGGIWQILSAMFINTHLDSYFLKITAIL